MGISPRIVRGLPLLLATPLLIATNGSVDPTDPDATIEAFDQNWEEALPAFEERVARDLEDAEAWYMLARARQETGDLDGAIDAGRRAAVFPSVRSRACFDLARAYALAGRPDDALDALDAAKRAGFADRGRMLLDPALASVRDDPRFRPPDPRHYHVVQLEDGTMLPIAVHLPPDLLPGQTVTVLLTPGLADPDSRSPSPFWGEESAQRGWMVVESRAFLANDPAGRTSQLMDMLEAKFIIEGNKFHLAAFDEDVGSMFQAAVALGVRLHTVSALRGVPPPGAQENLRWLKGARVNLFVGENDTDWLGPVRAANEQLLWRLVNTGVIPEGAIMSAA